MNVNIDVEQIVNRYQNVCSQLSHYIRDEKHPQFVLVTKNQPVALILNLLQHLESPIFGENRVSEALSKIEKCEASNAEWHYIGHLQRNKVKSILGKFTLIHSLADIKLAKEIEKRAVTIGQNVNCLIQIDISEDGTKFGFPPDQSYLIDLMNELTQMSHLQIKGLMTIAPFIPSEETRPYFRKMRSIFDVLAEQSPHLRNIEMEILSMGMSNDYIVALEEGSTMIRIGSAIFEDQSS
ncbi:YggS family pyridoxal phosphate-dependent enzyme [Candidatus Heimdallarchaeota archaeon B3_Heim]|nr:MAG: YggS family pyridoxal phosphate-dependent enzyme [Candidatus Heimdallarchaeota archaeon B3_Heim]